MEIYVVQQGDTIDSIALQFGITPEKLISDNRIQEPNNLVIGQTLVITYPQQLYTVKPGDTLDDIAKAFDITVMQILRNNPDVANRQYIYPGESLVISYNNNKGNILAAGYAYPYINDRTLKMTLPNLTYQILYNYQMNSNGEFIGGNLDEAVIQTAKLYDTPTTMVVTAFSGTGEIDQEVVYQKLLDQQLQNKIVENLLTILETKGYQGVNLAFQLINEANQQLYINYLAYVSNILHQEGYSVFITVNPGLKYKEDQLIFEKINYSELSQVCDGILFLSYDWGSLDRPPIQFSIITTSSLLDYIVAQVPLEKIRIVIPSLGYDWQLPYVPGVTKANTLNFDSALALASDMNAVIHYDEKVLSPYFEYVDINDNQHIVWFKDARSVDSSIKILKSYGIKGIGIWNIMHYFAQMWLVINTQYEIEKL